MQVVCWKAGFVFQLRLPPPAFRMNLVQSDSEIVRDNWNSTVLLQVTVVAKNGASGHSLYVMFQGIDYVQIVLNRHAYLPFVFFSPSLSSLDLNSAFPNGIEFRCGDVSLHWDYPVGVLYDVYADVGRPLSVCVCDCTKQHVWYFLRLSPSMFHSTA